MLTGQDKVYGVWCKVYVDVGADDDDDVDDVDDDDDGNNGDDGDDGDGDDDDVWHVEGQAGPLGVFCPFLASPVKFLVCCLN